MPALAADAHLVCAALAMIDITARALRLGAVLGALGRRLPLSRLMAITLACDALCAATPYRAGGEPARVAGLVRSGVPLRQAALAIAGEAIQTWPVILLCGVLLAWGYGGAWWRALRTGFVPLGPGAGLAFGVAVPATLIAAWLGVLSMRRLGRRYPVALGAPPAGRVRVSPTMLVTTVPLTLVAVSARVLILPVLIHGLTDAPIGPVALGSFVLIHGQLFLPSPAGAGPVDVALVAGIHGGADAGMILLFWRLYTTGIGAVLGAAATVALFCGRHFAAQSKERTGG